MTTQMAYRDLQPLDAEEVRRLNAGTANLSSRDLRECGEQLRKLTSLNLRNCDLRGIKFDRPQWSEVHMVACRFEGTTFAKAQFPPRAKIQFNEEANGEDGETHFDGCDLRGVTIHFGSGQPKVRFTGCTLNKSVLLGAPKGGDSIWFEWCRGLWGLDRANAHDMDPMAQEKLCYARGWPPTWEMLRRVGSTRLMSVSWVALIALISYAAVLRIYNEQIRRLKDLTETGQASAWWERLILAPEPWPFGMLLISILFIGSAATIVSWRCPQLVLFSNRHEWVALQGKERRDIEYQAASHDRLGWRALCALGYSGGIYAAWYLLLRFWEALKFFFG